jgi:hypothetical protein
MAPSCRPTATTSNPTVVIWKTRPCVVRPGIRTSATANSAGSPTKSNALSPRPDRTARTNMTAPNAATSPARIHFAAPAPRGRSPSACSLI